MKKIRFISSFFLIILILYPTIVGAMGSCDDDSACCESMTTIPDEKESDHDCMDLCLCSCCGNSVFFDVKMEIENDFSNFIAFHHVVFTYQSQFSSAFLADIWQPPRLV